MSASMNTMAFSYPFTIFLISCLTKLHFSYCVLGIYTNIVVVFLLNSFKKPSWLKKCLKLGVFLSESIMEKITTIIAYKSFSWFEERESSSWTQIIALTCHQAFIWVRSGLFWILLFPIKTFLAYVLLWISYIGFCIHQMDDQPCNDN